MDNQFSYDSVIALYLIGAIGALFIIVGVTWDSGWHLLFLIENFLAPPHLLLYFGMFLIFVASILGTTLWLLVFKRDNSENQYFKGFFISTIGSVILLLGGMFDFWWHELFGFDPWLFTPSHIVLLLGVGLNTIGIAYGIITLYRSKINDFTLNRFQNDKIILIIMLIVILGVLRLNLNAFGYVLVDIWGIGYTFKFNVIIIKELRLMLISISLLFIATISAIYAILVKNLIEKRGYFFLVIGIGALITLITDLLFQYSILEGTTEGEQFLRFIPFYIAFLFPVLIFDFVITHVVLTRKIVVILAMTIPFITLLDGWQSILLWNEFIDIVPFFIIGLMIYSAIIVVIILKVEQKIKRKIYKMGLIEI